MSGWLDDVLGGYLQTVTEREFDATFISLLWAKGYTDVHQLHGAFEFGKDFIAQRDGQQWSFQTKAGDIGLSGWRQNRSQIEEMLWNEIAHPGFDPGLRRRAVFVTTGRLVGGAAPDAQQYEQALRKRSGGPDGSYKAFEVWDRESLLEDFASTPGISLRDWGQDPLRELLGMLADIDRRVATVQSIERSTREWRKGQPWQAVLAASLAANRLAEVDRPDLACTVALAVARTAADLIHRDGPDEAVVLADAARSLYVGYAEQLLDASSAAMASPEALYRSGNEVLGGVTYRVRCLSIVQTIGTLGVLHLAEGNLGRFDEAAERLAEFVRVQPGAAHPISDRWAVSLVPAAITLGRSHGEELRQWLRQVVVWVCDRHDRKPGLASAFASPLEEIEQLLGDPYEHLEVRPRRISFIATVVLDLISVLGVRRLYDDAYNDFAAVDIAFPVVEPTDEVGQYYLDGDAIRTELNVKFDSEIGQATDGWETAVHHRRSPPDFLLDRHGRSWELMACSLLLRDRHFLTATRHLAAAGKEA